MFVQGASPRAKERRVSVVLRPTDEPEVGCSCQQAWRGAAASRARRAHARAPGACTGQHQQHQHGVVVLLLLQPLCAQLHGGRGEC